MMDEIIAEMRYLLEAGVPIGATRLRRGAWWKKIAGNKWKMLRHVRQHGIEVGKHPPTQPIPQSWQRREKYNR